MTTPKANVTLQTRDGGEVAAFECLVLSLMKPCPEIVVWGERLFILAQKSPSDMIYKEGFVFPLIDGATAKKVL